MTEVFDLKEASEYMHLAKSTLYKYVGLGVVPCFRVGRVLRFKREVLDTWMREQSAVSTAKPVRKRRSK